MRAKDWTMVVASESHLIYSLPPATHFANLDTILSCKNLKSTVQLKSFPRQPEPWFYFGQIWKTM